MSDVDLLDERRTEDGENCRASFSVQNSGAGDVDVVQARLPFALLLQLLRSCGSQRKSKASLFQKIFFK